ncbi:MAG TPA: Ldh family oxidoreductase [Candidatus Sulfotelmatobacter sp.]|nr:Ldh family oxidoreductase [Candidatus Sulfotelmatobacter sp.]
MSDRFNPDLVKTLAAAIAVKAGVRKADAAILADALVDADMHGTSTHGISRLNIYIRRIQKGLINPKAKLVIERRRGSAMAVDAGNGLGQVQAVKTLEKLVPRAKRNGVAAATIRNSQHFGALSYYCNLAAKQDMILFATSGCEPAMSPEGACQAFFGTNPIAASFPTGKGWPVKIDLATSIVARGNIIAAQKRGQPIPLGWALTSEGEPTTDAAAALAGTVLTMAGHKGYALALLVEIFSSVLSGASVGPAIGSMYKNMDRKQDVGHFFFLLDISAFMDVAEFKLRLDKTIDDIKSCRKRPGVNDILVPGERSHQKARQNLAEGISVDEATRKELKALCEELRVKYTLEESVSPQPAVIR